MENNMNGANSMDIDLLSQSFKMQLINLINEGGKRIPPSMIYYIVKEVYQNVENGYNEYIISLKQQMEASTHQEEQSSEEKTSEEN